MSNTIRVIFIGVGIATTIAVACFVIIKSGVLCEKSLNSALQRSPMAYSDIEFYDPQDMGGRNYWGFGRPYGYPQRDMDFAQQICYQVSSRELCREGYSRNVNPSTLGDECCVNSFVYQ